MRWIILTGSLLVSSLANAGSVGFDKSFLVLGPGETFELKVLGQGFDETEKLDAFGFKIQFDPTALTLTSIFVAPAWSLELSPFTIDSVAGIAHGGAYGLPFGVEGAYGNFDLATLSFQASAVLPAGWAGVVTLEQDPEQPFASGGNNLNDAVLGSPVEVAVSAVPLPAAAFLFLGGLIAPLVTSWRNVRSRS